MTFDIDKAISDRFAKAGPGFKQQADGTYIDSYSDNLIKDKQAGISAANDAVDTAKGAVDKASKRSDMLSGTSQSYQARQGLRDAEKNLQNAKDNQFTAAEKLGDARANAEILNPSAKDTSYWRTPMARPDARYERTAAGAADLSDQEGTQAAARQAAKRAGTSKVTTPQGMANAVPENNFMFGETDTNRNEFANLQSYLEGKGMPRNEAYNWIRDQYSKHGVPNLFDGIESLGIEGGRAWELPARSAPNRQISQYDPNTAKTPMEQVNRSCDINTRMNQWTVANAAQHVSDIEPILKGDKPYVKDKDD